MTVKQLAEALGYADRKKLSTLIRRNQLEFQHKIVDLKLRSTDGKQYNQQVINYHGVIRAAMLSNAPRSIEFRDWAETVLFSVMTKGAYIQASAEGLVVQRVMESVKNEISTWISTSMNQALNPLTHRIGQLELDRNEMKESFARTYIPRDVGTWPTPTQLLRVISKEPLPKGFNSGADFDRFAAEEHKAEFGHYPEARCRRYMQKRHDWVVEPCPETNDFARRAYKKYLHTRWPGRQGKLKLVLPRSKKPKLK